MGRVVQDRYFAYTILVPAGTAIEFPQTTTIAIDNLILQSFHLGIPDGHVGLTGFALEFATKRIVPWDDPDAWITSNDEEAQFAVGIEVGGHLNVVTYNLGKYDHRFYLRLHVRYLADERPGRHRRSALVLGRGQ